MEITTNEITVEVLHFPSSSISLDVWSSRVSGEVHSARLTPEQALLIAATLQKAAMAELEL